MLVSLLPLLAIAAAETVRGVSPQNQHLYAPQEGNTWRCLLDPSIVLSYDQINDDYCECPDGSDEPGTAACPYTKESPKVFYCANEGYIPRDIENYKVGDGVCDYDVCCDGSDEYASGDCPNKCGEVSKQFAEYVGKKKANIETALATKLDLEEKAKKVKEALREQVISLQKDVDSTIKKIAEIQKQLEASQKSTDSDDQGSSIGDELALYAGQVEEKIQRFRDADSKSQQKISQLEEMLAALVQNYNPNFNDQSVKTCVKQFGEYMSNKQEVEVPEATTIISTLELAKKLEGFKTKDIVQIVPSFDNMLHHYFSKVISTFKPAEERPDEVRVKTTSKEQNRILEQIANLEKTLKAQQSEVSIYEDSIGRSYGNNDIFRAVQDTWVTEKIGEYTYKLGFLDSVYQDNTLIGRLTGVDKNTLHFTGGSRCWNGPQRSAIVDMVCATDHKLISVSEPEKCQYRFLLETPIVCGPLSDDEIAQGFNVNLAEL